MFCPECGAKVEENSIYCSECGNKIEIKIEEVQTVIPINKNKKTIPNLKLFGVVALIGIIVFTGTKMLNSEKKVSPSNDNIISWNKSEREVGNSIEKKTEKIKDLGEKITNVKGCKAKGCDEPVFKNGYCDYHYGYEIGQDVGKEIKKGINDLKDIGYSIGDLFGN